MSPRLAIGNPFAYFTLQKTKEGMKRNITIQVGAGPQMDVRTSTAYHR